MTDFTCKDVHRQLQCSDVHTDCLWHSVRMSLGVCPGPSPKFWRLVGCFKFWSLGAKSKLRSVAFQPCISMGGGKYSKNWRKTWFRPNFRPKNTNFSGQKFWPSDFGGVCGPKFWNLIIFDTIPTKYGYRRPKLAMGSYASVQNIWFNIIIHFLIQRTPKNTKKCIFSYFPQLLAILMP